MSAELERALLLEAVAVIRATEPDDSGLGWYTVQSFPREVANWLEVEAECDVPPEWDPSCDVGWQYALRIARAYLRDAS